MTGKRAPALISLACLSLLGIAVLLFSTRYGPGVGGDATIYLTSARNLLAGAGLGLLEPDGSFRLLPYFAPFFPLLLAFFGLFTADLLAAAHWLNLLLFTGLIFLSGWATFRLTRSLAWGLLAGGLVMASPILIPVYSWAMSEPLSLFLGFLGLWLLLPALRREKPGLLFFLSALFTGLSFLTRYSCAAFIVAAALAWLIFRASPFSRRLAESLLYALAAALPMLPWVIANLARTATVSSRSLLDLPAAAGRLVAFWPRLSAVVLSWLVPFSWMETPPYPALLNRLLSPALLLLAVAGLVYVLRRAPRPLDDRLRWASLLALLAAAYLAVILLVYAATYPPITIDNRMLSPVHVALFWLLVILSAWIVTQRPIRAWRMILPLALLVVLAWSGWRSVRIVRQNYDTGLGYTSPAWQQSQTIQAVRALPADQPIVTNEVTAVLFLTGRRAYTFMEIYRDRPLPAFTRYGDGDLTGDPGQQLFRQARAPLVLFDTAASQLQPVYGGLTPARLSALTAGLIPIFTGSDGTIYMYPEP